MEAMEEWGHADDRVILRSYTAEMCISTGWTFNATPALAAP